MVNLSKKFFALLLLFSPLIVHAAKPGPTIAGPWPSGATLMVSNDHVLNWQVYTGFTTIGYDVYYGESDQEPGYNPTRLETGAQIGWTDSLPGYEGRCIASNYWIRAYDRGRKSYSPILRAESGSLCGPTAPVADAGADQTVVIEAQTVTVGLDGSGSGGDIASYDWSVTESPTGSSWPSIDSGETTSVTFNSTGTYTITLTVTDTGGNTDSDSLDVTVSDTVPPPPEELFSETQGVTPSCDGQTVLGRTGNFPDGYTNLVFSDEFNGPTLNSNVWNSRYEWSSIINNEAQYYVDALGDDSQSGWSPFSIANGKLTITAKTTSSVNLPDGLTEQPYVSGVLNTQHKVSFNGAADGGLFFETYARPARGNGMWTAFWLYHRTYTNPDPEIDVMEYLGQSKAANGGWIKATNKDGVGETANYNTWDTQYHTYYPGAGGPKGKKSSNYTNQKLVDAPNWCGPQPPEDVDFSYGGVDFSYAFHKYSMEWTSEHIKWYIDDILLHTVTSAERKIANEDMYIILNLAIGSNYAQDVSWPGAPDSYTVDLINDGNATMVVDWVRVYGK